MPSADAVSQSVLSALRDREEELTGLLTDLIRHHPVYGTDGQITALELLRTRLTAAGFSVRLRSHSPKDLQPSPEYVDVPALGDEFADYPARERWFLTAEREFGPGGPHVLLNGHVDVDFVTAPQDWAEPGLWRSGVERDGRIVGRGACDMLGGVAAYVHVLTVLAPHLADARGAVTVHLVLDEEIGGNGTLAALLGENGRRFDVGLIAEPTGGVVCNRTYGFHQFLVRCFGDPVHMAFAGGYDNAHRVLADLIPELEELDEWIAGRTGAPSRTRHVMYGVITGGSDAAVPAETCDVQVTLALPPMISPDEAMDRLAAKLSRLTGPRRPPVLESYGLSFPGSSHDDPRWCDTVLGSGRSCEVPLARGDFPSACDARLLESAGIPTLVYGPGSLTRAHSSDEYVTRKDLADYCQVLAQTLLTLWSPHA
ncbi:MULTISPECIES: M20 family metallopeptidase [unclassified Streptomyces]|uniref:M20 family metallopeptidase n=1 Tax=unclassified Streptomyces TaxID=2593676 RepID=UPI003251DFCE